MNFISIGNSVPRGGYTNSQGRGRGMGPGPYSQKRPAPTGPSGMAMAAKKVCFKISLFITYIHFAVEFIDPNKKCQEVCQFS